MSAGFRRSLIDVACRALLVVLPSSLQPWGWAVRYEAASIPDDTKALLYTLHSMWGLMPRALASHLLQPFASLIGGDPPFCKGPNSMTIYAMIRCPRTIGVACAVGAVVLGLAYMVIAKAPIRYLAINAAALVIGLTILVLLGRTVAAGRAAIGAAIAAMAAALLATALIGASADGAARWVSLGGLAIQPSSILVPLMLVAFSRTRTMLATAGIAASAAAIALQPDRAMAGILALSLATLAIISRDRHVIVALVASVAGFAGTLAQADTLMAVPYVDQILYSSFDIHALAGVAVWGGLALLLIPAIVGWRRDAANRATYAVFGALWFATIVAAALGNYPTPAVGYGGSAIIGYALSLLGLPRATGVHARAGAQTARELGTTWPDQHLSVRLA